MSNLRGEGDDGIKRESRWDRIRKGAPHYETPPKLSEESFDADTTDVMEIFLGPIPMLLNLSDRPTPSNVVGWARAYRKTDGTTHIAIHLDAEASEQLKDLADIFELKALGFAGVARQPELPEG